MRIFFLIAMMLIWFVTPAFAQNTGKITGHITGTNETALDTKTATISLLRAKDSAVVKLTLANKEGLFTFENLASSKYVVAVTAIGYQKAYSTAIEITADKQNIQLPAIELIPATKTLAAVTVTSKRPLIEQKIDRTIVNVEASITNIGTSALEVLEKSPGVTVDKDGNISLKGKAGVMVMIDNRPTQLSGGDLANLLSNMNSSQLDQIEIMTNPPARYDAAGNAGIINIKTKKTKTMGYNGSATLNYTQGRYPKINEAFNFNYRKSNFNFFSNLSHSYNKGYKNLSIQRNLRNSGSGQLEKYFDQEADMLRTGTSFNGKIGLDYFANKKTTFGVVLNGFTSSSTLDNSNRTDISTASKQLESRTLASVNNSSEWKSFSANLNFRRLLDAKGKELTSDFDYATYDSKNEQFMVNAYFNPSGNPTNKADTLMGALPQNIEIYSGRLDYIHPLEKGAKFEAGIKSSSVSTDNNAIYDSIQYGTIRHDFNRSNHFIYNENINAAYVNFSKPITKKISAQLGLRFENTIAKGDQLTTDTSFKRSNSQLFPTAFFQYKLNEKNNLGLNYGRRIRRPNYESLNPFIRFIDRYTYNQGNPDLKPQFSHNIELSHTYKNFLTTTLNYTATTDIIESVMEQKGQEAYVRQANIASLHQYGISVSANHSPTTWWTNNIYVNVFNNKYEGIVNNELVSLSASSYIINGSQQFKITKTLTAEINGRYRSSWMEGVLRAKPIGILAAGFSKQVLENKGTLRLTVRDIFHSQRFRGRAIYGNVDAAFQEVNDTRVVAVGFTYRFSKGKMGTQRKRTTGSAGEELNRVGID